MNGRYLLDTNIVIPLLAGDSWIKEKVQKSAEIFIPVIVIGELLYGVQKSSRRIENIAKINEFINFRNIGVCSRLYISRTES